MAAPFELLRQIARDGEPAVMLEGAWSAVAAAPAASLCVVDGRVWRRAAGEAWREAPGDAWSALRAFVAEARHPPGVVGIASYDAGRLIERLPELAVDDTRLPQLLFHRFDAGWVGGELVGERRAVEVLRERAGRDPEPFLGGASFEPVEPHLSPKAFEAMVVEAKKAIRAGEVFQANLSHRLETTTTCPPLELYGRLRVANPAPFAAYLASGDLPAGAAPFHVLSSSPERLFRLEAGRLEARPIAGTRPRGRDTAEDERLKAELLADPKERAEHVMLVDLARNDLGRVARYGSVRVPHLLTIETYRTVHHLVSVVEAELARGKDAVDALVALFPGGTITGAPKVRAMEVIEGLEPVRRGVYTGSLAWFDPAGGCDVNILIRTLLYRGGRVHLQVGAGIVEDSVPHREYEETLAKAKGMLRALGATPE